jgi:hypothetical protein
MSVSTAGVAAMQLGSAEVSSTGADAPSGLAIFGYRNNGVLISEAGTPASTPMLRGRIYVDVAGAVNTGFAISNPNDSQATVTFTFTNSSGQDAGSSSLTLAPHAHVARFVDQAPFNLGRPANGTLTFSSNVPVSAIALRGFTNERSEFLVTALPLSNIDAPVSGTTFFPHLADGGGWSTQFVLVNPSDQTISGSLAFFAQGNAGANAGALTLTVDGQARSSVIYSIPPRSSRRFATAGTDAQVQVGSAKITPDLSSTAPDGVAVFSFKKAAVTVAEAGVPAIVPGKAFRMYAEVNSAGAIRTGVAAVNTSSSSVHINFELIGMNGVSTGLTGSLDIPGFGQRALFLQEIPGFQSLPAPFKGILRISSANQADIAITGLRGRSNERGDFLITTTDPVNENTPPDSKIVFPHFVDGGGYTTQFVTFSGTNSEPSSGNLKMFSESGSNVILPLH